MRWMYKYIIDLTSPTLFLIYISGLQKQQKNLVQQCLLESDLFNVDINEMS